MAFYPKGVAYTRTFKMISSSDHISLKTGATPAVQIAKNGGAFGSPAGTISEIAFGWYKVALTTTDTNTAGDLSFLCTGFGTDDTDFSDQVLDPSTYSMGVNVVSWLNTSVTAATAGIPDVNVKNYNNQTATTDANNLPNVNTQDWLGVRATSVLIQGVPRVDTEYWLGKIATYDANSLPNVNVQDWAGNVASFTDVPGVPRVNVWTWRGTAPLDLSSQQVQAVVPASTVVASVTGAVGSVTGNVGGNVVGSVGWVTGSVGSVAGNVSGNVVGSVGSVATAVFINANVKKNAALSNFLFLITDSTNHLPATGAAALTPTRSIDGGAFGSGSLSAVTEIASGWYSINFSASDLNGNNVAFRCTSTNNDDVDILLVTAP